jgi:TRAP-type transport system small permease protein
MRKFGKLVLDNFEVALSAAFISVTILVVIINVILRYVFKGGFFWVEEVATVSFIWSVFVGAAAAYRHKMHIGIDLITSLFPERVRELISIIINLLMVIINAYIVYLSFLFIQANQLKRTPVLDVPAGYVNAAIAVGFGLMTVHAVRFLIAEAKLFFGTRRKA